MPEDSSPDIDFAIRRHQRWQQYGKLREAELLDYADARKKTTLTLTCQEYWDFAKKFTDAWEAMVRNEMDLEDANTTYQATRVRKDEAVVLPEEEESKTIQAEGDVETVKASPAGGEASQSELLKDDAMLEIENKKLSEDIQEWLGNVAMTGMEDE